MRRSSCTFTATTSSVTFGPDAPATMVIEAFAAGRFPITSHGWGGGDGGATVAAATMR